MEERQTSEAPEKGTSKCCLCGIGMFVLGLVVALAFGWGVFPNLIYSQKEQPIRFSHKVHIEDANMECAQCHSLREDGSFAGLPTTAQCAECHSSVVGSDPAEARFVSDYVETGKQVPWLVYQKQPDNVFFSHAAHSLKNCNKCHEFTERELCNFCHIDVASTDTPPVYYQNWLTGYSKNTMKMWQCERCHANENHYEVSNASNGCFVCHK